MFRFASPFAFLLFAPLLLSIWRVYRRRARRGLLFAATARLPASRHTWRTRMDPVLPLLIFLGLSLSIIALARPQMVFSRTIHSSDAIAIQIVVDISGSMNALDFAGVRNPNRTRLDVVKETFSAFVDKRSDDLVGLVTFGGYATSRVPLTIDHRVLQHVLDGVDVPRHKFDARNQVLNAEELMTAIGDGLATACARLKEAEVASKIVLLLSDGESNAGIITPDKAVQIAKKLGIKVYTIGVGSRGVTTAKVVDSRGRTRIERIRVALDEKLLKTIARETGGVYHNVRDAYGLARAMAEIDKLERTEINREVYSQYSELFPPYLATGAALLALGLCLNVVASRKLV